MYDITKDPDFTDIYNKMPTEQPGDSEMAEERRFFMSHVEHLSMHLTFFQQNVQRHKDMFITDSDFMVSSVVRMLDDGIDHTGYERLKVMLK